MAFVALTPSNLTIGHDCLKRENFMICCSYGAPPWQPQPLPGQLFPPSAAKGIFRHSLRDGRWGQLLHSLKRQEMWPPCSLAGSKGAAEGKADEEFSLETQASFFAVEHTWFLVKMSMEKVTTACTPSYIPSGAYRQVWCLCGWDILTDSCVFQFHILSCHIHSRWWVLTVGLYINHNSNTTPVALARHHIWDWAFKSGFDWGKVWI